MLELEVRLPRETKKIEWDKDSPTFCEVKERLENCGVARNWCVEILRGDEYLSLDDNTQLNDVKKLTVRASPISEEDLLQKGPSARDETGTSEARTTLSKKPEVAEMFENVISYVGRVFVCDRGCEDSRITSIENCKGTVGLIGSNGESIGCWHTVEDAVLNRRGKYKVFIEYPNYPHNLFFQAQIKDNLISNELDLFVAEPIEELEYETAHLQCANDVALADSVHCFGFPDVVDREIVSGYKKMKRKKGEKYTHSEVERRLKLPTILSGRVCFNGWKQAVADYLCFPNCSGGIVVDDYGRLKGVHVAAFRVGRKLNFQRLRVTKAKLKSGTHGNKKQDNINVDKSLRKLYEGMNSFCSDTACCLNACKNEVAAFVPIHIFEEPLELKRLRLIRWKQPKSSLLKSRGGIAETEDNRHGKKARGQTSQNPLIWF